MTLELGVNSVKAKIAVEARTGYDRGFASLDDKSQEASHDPLGSH
jgi:hypothetical protein